MGFNTKKVTKTRPVQDPGGPGGDESVGSFGTSSAGSFSTKSATKREPSVPTGPKRSIPWGIQQKEFFRVCAEEECSIIVEALAGSGKSTSIVEALNYLKGKIFVSSFGKLTVADLTSKIEAAGLADKIHCSTLHGLGLRLIQRLQPGTGVDNMRGLGLALAALQAVGGPVSKNYQWMVKNTASIVKEVAPYVKVTEGKVVAEIGYAFGHLDRLDPRFLEVTCDAVLDAMRRALEPTGNVDYSDMLYVPLHRIASRGEYDVVVVDEAQDMNRAQLALAQQVLKENGRLIVVGDRHQAIYGFRGADKGSMDRLAEAFKAKILPLSVTYRCPKDVVSCAQAFVPALEAAPSAPSGTVAFKGYEYLIATAKAGDFILSRLNAPLLRLCLQFIKEGRPAIVEGRDVGAGLVNLINKLTFGNPTFPLRQFLDSMRVHVLTTSAKFTAEDDLERAKQVEDQGEAMRILAEGCGSIGELKAHIDKMFEDTGGKANKIILSTVHKAKGLESPTVYILCDTFKGPWDHGEGEEANLKYVAITRSKNTLVFIDHPTGPEEKS